MGGGGSIQGMITSLKNNRRPKASAFKRLKGYENVNYKKGEIEKKATPQQLRVIREKMQQERRQEQVITIIVIAIVFSILSLLF